MEPGKVAIVGMALGALAGFSLGLGCSHQAAPVVQPEERAPLPPTSGTPIGHLIDGAAELKLSDDQLGKLKAISDELAGQLAGDDTGLRPDPVPTSPRERKPHGLGVRAGGTLADGQSSGTPSPDNESGRVVVITPETATQVYQRRSHHIRDALRRALPLLDAGQQAIARRLLIEHGVDPDTGQVDDPGVTKLDPQSGQPLPREP